MARFSDGDNVMVNPITGPGLDSAKVSGIIVIVALLLLILIRRGFRGVNVLGASARLG